GDKCLLTRFSICHWHELQAYAGMGVGDGAHEGSKELLAIAAQRTSSHTQGYMGKEEPSHDSPDSDASEQACEDHQQYASSILAHCSSPFVSLGRQPKVLRAAGSRHPTLPSSRVASEPSMRWHLCEDRMLQQVLDGRS